MAHDTYQSPLASRYASDYMLRLFSDDSRYQTWRRLWAALARVQHELGLPITEAQAAELEAHITDIDYDIAAQRERDGAINACGIRLSSWNAHQKKAAKSPCR